MPLQKGKAVVTLKYEKAPRGYAQKFRDGLRTGLLAIGIMWHNKFLPRHFTTEAYNKYGYQRRSKGYELRKAKKYHHRRPLEYTGALRAAVMNYWSVKASTKQMVVDLKGPKWLRGYLAFRGRRGTAPNKEVELLSTADDEARAFFEQVQADIFKAIDKKNPATVTVTG